MINWIGMFVTATLEQLRIHSVGSLWMPDFQSLSPAPYDLTAFADACFQADEIGSRFGYRLHHTVWTPSGFLFVFAAA